jgi:ribosomal protein L11 methyltransferase
VPQVRFFARTSPKAAAQRLYNALEAIFEEDGLPLAIVELDEATDTHEVSLYAEADDPDVSARFGKIAADAGLEYQREELPDVDWVAHTLAALKPVRAGRFLLHGAHDRDKVRPGDIAIEIEAGLAFGTGHHGTTAGCLEVLTDVVTRERPRRALDLGTGSAVLAIALAKLARIPILATDIDPVATRVARENVRLNQMSSYVLCETATGFGHPAFARAAPFDLIVANILARPLMRLAPRMATHIAPGGSLVLSGILDRQRNAVVAAYVGQRFRHVRTLHREGWVTIHLKR